MERLIDANELLERMKTIENFSNQKGMFAVAREMIENAPTVDAEPIEHGKWIPITKGAPKEIYICNRCHRQVEDDGIPALIPIRYPYCHCGAKMDEVEDVQKSD